MEMSVDMSGYLRILNNVKPVLKKLYNDGHIDDDQDTDINNVLWIAEEMAKYFLTNDNNTWIPCAERLPEPFEEVLISGGDRQMVVGYVDEDNDWNVGLVNDGELDTHVSSVVYWQHLPQPPAGKDGVE